jgi:hypothetical protein
MIFPVVDKLPITHHEAVRGHVLGYDRSCADDGVLADTLPRYAVPVPVLGCYSTFRES